MARVVESWVRASTTATTADTETDTTVAIAPIYGAQDPGSGAEITGQPASEIARSLHELYSVANDAAHLCHLLVGSLSDSPEKVKVFALPQLSGEVGVVPTICKLSRESLAPGLDFEPFLLGGLQL